jgi:hypothetical protein
MRFIKNTNLGQLTLFRYITTTTLGEFLWLNISSSSNCTSGGLQKNWTKDQNVETVTPSKIDICPLPRQQQKTFDYK